MAMAEFNGVMDGRGGPQWVRWDASAWWQGCVPFLTFEEEGFYVRCCNYMYRTATPLPLNDKLAASLLCSDPRVYRRLKRKLVEKGKLIECQAGVINERVMNEIDRARTASMARVKGARRATTSRERTRASNTRLLDSLKFKIAAHRGCEPSEISDQDANLAFDNMTKQIDFTMSNGKDFAQTSGELPPKLRKSKPIANEDQTRKSDKKSNEINGSTHAQRNASVTVSVTDKNKKERKKDIESSATSESVTRVSDLAAADWSDPSADEMKQLRDLLWSAADGVLNTQAINLEVMAEPIAWLNAGADLKLDVLPAVAAVTLRSRRAGRKRISSWNYFQSAVLDNAKQRKTNDEAIQAAMGETANAVAEKDRPKTTLEAIAMRRQAEADRANGGAG